jgi:hypothetical protein
MNHAAIYDEVLQHFDGSAEKLRASLEVESTSPVYMWRIRGIPAKYAKRVELMTGISVKRIRPDDWRLYWPEPTRRAKRKTASATREVAA